MAQSVFNLAKNIVGIGVLSLPAAVAAGTGLIPAVILTVALGVYSGYTFSLYGRVCEATGERNFKGLGLATAGPRWASAMTWACTLRTVFSCLAFSIVVADSFSAILQSFGAPAALCARNTVLGGMSLFVILPLCLLPDLSALSYTSLLGSLGMLYTMVFMTVRRLDGSYAPGGAFFDAALAAGSASGRWSVNVSTLVLVSTLGTACSAHYNAPRFYEQLRNRSVGRFNTVVAVSFSVAVAMCLTAMCAGFQTFGAASRGNILLNYSTRDPLATAARIAVSSSVVCTYPLAFTGLRDGVLSLLGVPATKRNFCLATVGLLSTVTGLAWVIQNVAFVVNLGGAVFGALTVYIFPCVLFLLLKRKKARGPERQLAKATVVGGVLLALLGSVVAVLTEFAPARLR
eukprot:CAMPEP_0204528686 /NCGR_PEP_ID=MMETSP0661-20131031/9660_1 /ASSEMBLY_ACC=CAM_ASM_000606 /TAXON_ID=109239 /ORGANISM="Alexandrium margalefi, Strain AMGDE01CS-322" /LENGTH=401 /DNA_ID=CAMNT_0051534677 /DNA_START=24 /DNA_END=1229 /DNA_ORIENTATION=-